MDRIIRRLQQRVPAKDVELGDPVLSPEEQDQLVASLDLFSNKHYVQQILKKFIAVYEQAGHEISDSVYETFCSPQIMSAPPLTAADLDIVTYHINGKDIAIEENPNVILGAGTTGRRTWEAALFLSETLPELDISGTVCELGAGTALAGIAAMDLDAVEKVIITDGFPALLPNIEQNISLNKRNQSQYQLQPLLWGEDECPACDYVIAADVTYDESIVQELVGTICTFLKNGTKKAYIAATVRNTDTLAAFEQELTSSNANWVLKTTFTPKNEPGTTVWYRALTPIRLYQISI